MSVETKEQVEQFILLQGKDEEELRAICEGMKLSTKGKKPHLLQRLMSLQDPQYQRSVARPQAIPLRTRGPNGQPLPAAMETMKKWRRLIFEGRRNTKEFSLINSRGKSYKARLRYTKCGRKSLDTILEKGWYMAHTSQRDLVNLLKNRPENFNLSIIQKPDSQGNSWLMLHCEAKAA